MLIRARLEAASVRDLREVLSRLRLGSIGFDVNRHPVCSKKPGLIDFIISSGRPGDNAPTTDDLLHILDAVQHGDGKDAPREPEQPDFIPPQSGMPTTPQQPSPQKDDQDVQPATPNNTEAAQQLAALIAQLTARAGVDPEQVRDIVRAELDQRPPRQIVITRPDGEKHKTDGYRHPMFEKVLRLSSVGLNVLMVGPAGSGKTTIASQVAEALGRPFGMISLTAGASESQLLGRFLPTGENGQFEYTDTPFIRMYEGGGVFLLDEFDAADPNMAITLNAATANGHFFNDYRTQAPRVDRHGDTVILAAANTYGTGADAIYAGRSQLDAATLDRFYIVHVDYDDTLDRSIAGMAPGDARGWEPAGAPTNNELQKLGAWILQVREKVSANKLRRVFSPRATHKAIAARSAGIPTGEVKADLLAGWTRDELAKLGSLAPAMA